MKWLSAGILFIAWLPDAAGADWPQWRGPGSQGISADNGVPVEWGPARNIAWQSSLAGSGVSSPIVTGGLVIITSQLGGNQAGRRSDPRLARDDSALAARENAITWVEAPGGRSTLIVEAFRLSDGSRVWEYRTEAAGEAPEVHEKHNLATPTPAADGKRIYAWFGNGQLLALDLEGRLVWQRHLGREYGTFLNQWGHGSSPTVYRDLLILLCDHRPVSYLLALDAATGTQRWKVDRGKGRVSHSTPVAVAGPRGDELIINSNQRIDAYQPSTGEPLWHAGAERQTPIPSPVFDKGVIYLSRGYRNSDIWALRPGGRGDVTESHRLWRMPGGGSYVPSIIQYQGLVYMTNEIGVVTCASAETGKALWRERLGGIFFASPVAAGGKVYLVSETGETFVLRAGPKAEVLARNALDARFLASPAIADGRLLLRSDTTLFAIARTAAAPEAK